ncbi:MAG TPA: hypothetical protein VMB81_22060 [Candidatus Sulfotelmatobacter sp.]|nr:hypothetical protein [Candidatus Sulfotelmatobacter sp.]
MAGERDKSRPQGREISSQDQVDAFLAKVKAAPPPVLGQRGRLIFALDATASREPTWDAAMHIQAEMFNETAALGGLDIQLVFYRGFGEFVAGPWDRNAPDMLRRMSAVVCAAGKTQIAKVLVHARAEAQRAKVGALVFVGDCVEEDVDQLGQLAGELGLLGVRAFLFHEGADAAARRAFEHIARLTGGACCPFDRTSANQLKDLLSAVAVYAAGGQRALADFSRRRGGIVRQLTHQLDR